MLSRLIVDLLLSTCLFVSSVPFEMNKRDRPATSPFEVAVEQSRTQVGGKSLKSSRLRRTVQLDRRTTLDCERNISFTCRTRKTALDRGRTDRISMPHALDL